MHFVLAITTFNRKQYLEECLSSWLNTRTPDATWTIIIADDGSNDGTLDFLENLDLKMLVRNKDQFVLLKHNRIGIHQQMNMIISTLEDLEFDFCFKVDDDLQFLNRGWDLIYYQTAMATGFEHLVFCDDQWCPNEVLVSKIVKDQLVGKVSKLNVHGFFYTLTPGIIKKVGYFDVENFGFRGMGHVDYTVRCGRAGFTSIETPWDIYSGNDYLSAFKPEYKSVLPASEISAYDSFFRDKKESIILQNRTYINRPDVNYQIYDQFKSDILLALKTHFENSKMANQELNNWYHSEIEKTKSWYQNRFGVLPNWYVSLGNKLFGRLSSKKSN